MSIALVYAVCIGFMLFMFMFFVGGIYESYRTS